MKKILLILFLLAMLFSLTGCVNSLEYSAQTPVTYDKNEKTLFIPMDVRFWGDEGAQLHKLIVYYTTDSAKKQALENSDWEQVETFNVKSVLTDQGKTVSLSMCTSSSDTSGTTVEAYKQYGSVTEWREPFNGVEVWNASLNPTILLSGLELEDGDTVYFRVYVASNQLLNKQNQAEMLTEVSAYTFRDVVGKASAELPQTGDTSSMLLYVMLLGFVATAFGVMHMRKKEG